jgi:polyisoprenoid-binding protein YceI
MRIFKSILTVVLLLTSFFSISQVSWWVDRQHGHFAFSVKYMAIGDYEGRFKFYDGKIYSKSETDFTDASFDLMVDLNSVSAEDEGHEGMLKDVGMFDVANYPVATFKSSSMKLNGPSGTYDLEGDLTIKGISKKVKLVAVAAEKPITNPYFNQTNYGFKITGTIKRSEFGLTGLDKKMDNGMPVVGDEVKISCDLILIKASRMIPKVAEGKITLDQKDLAKFVGLYNLDRNILLSISAENGKLFAQMTNLAKIEVFPVSPNKFLYEFRDIELEFIKDANGVVVGYIRTARGTARPQISKISDPDSLKGNEDMFNVTGSNLLAVKNYVEAIKFLKRGQVLFPNVLPIQMNLAHCYLFNNDYSSAVKIYKSHLTESYGDYKWTDMIKNDFIYFKNNKFDKSMMDKVFAELKLEVPEKYKAK